MRERASTAWESFGWSIQNAQVGEVLFVFSFY